MCADKSVCDTLGAEFAGDAEVAKFDLAVATEKNVRWFNVCSRMD